MDESKTTPAQAGDEPTYGSPLEEELRLLHPRPVSEQVDAVVMAAADVVALRLRRRHLARRGVLVVAWTIPSAAAAILIILALGRSPDPATVGGPTSSDGPMRDGTAQTTLPAPIPQSSPVAAVAPTEVTLMARTLRLELEVARLQRLARRAGNKTGYRTQLELLETTLETIETRLIDHRPPDHQPAARPAPSGPKEETGHDDTEILLPGPHRHRFDPAGLGAGECPVS